MMKFITSIILVCVCTFANASDKQVIEQMLQTGKYNTAIQEIDSKLNNSSLIDEQKAVLHYYKAQALLALDKKTESLSEFNSAKDLDNASLFKNTPKYQSYITRANYQETTNASVGLSSGKDSSTQIKVNESKNESGISGWLILGLIVTVIGAGFGIYWLSQKKTFKKNLIDAMKQDQNACGVVISDLTNLLNIYKESAVDLKIRDKSLEDLTPMVEDEKQEAQKLLKQMIAFKDKLDALVATENVTEDEHRNLMEQMPADLEDRMTQLYENQNAISYALHNAVNLNKGN